MNHSPNYELSKKQKAFVEAAKEAGQTVDYSYSSKKTKGKPCPAVYCLLGKFHFPGASIDISGKQFVFYMKG